LSERAGFLHRIHQEDEMRRSAVLLTILLATGACATLENLRQLVQPPRFDEVRDQPAEIRLQRPDVTRPLGGVTVRLWTRVTNPNPFGITLTTLNGTLYLEGTRAATASFPLGLPLEARQESVIPLDLAVSIADLPALANVVRRASSRQPVEYALEGTIGIDAGRLGQPLFGPMPIVRGELRASSL
jgi:hypothetical protein